jgi:ribosomal protein L37AE/L43A
MNSTPALLAHIDIPPRLLASLIVLGFVLVIWFFKAILSKPAVTRTGAPTCTTCGQQAHWLMPQNYWNCMRCNKPVQTATNPYTGQPIQQQAQPPGPTCATCGGPGRWLADSNAWGCDHCRQLIQPR